MSSKRRSKSKPRLSVAMDVDPTATDQFKPPGTLPDEAPEQPTQERQPAEEPTEAGSTAPPAQQPRRQHEREQPPRRSSARSAKPQGMAAPEPTGDPLVQEINGRTYVMVGEDLMPEAARVQMTIALTAIERHRWSRYAEARRMTMIDLLRERMQGIFSGEEE